MSRFILSLGLFSVAVPAQTQHQLIGFPQPTQYQIIDLGVLPGQSSSSATAINDDGYIVGTSGSRGFLYHCGNIYDIGTLGGTETIPHGINNHLSIVGRSRNAQGAVRAFFWSNGVMEDLGGTSQEETALAVNRFDFAVGMASLSGGLFPEAQWYYGGNRTYEFPPIVITPPFGVGHAQFATAVNDIEQAVGYLVTDSNNGQFGSSAVGMVSAPGFGNWTRITGPSGRSQFVFPMGINNNAVVAGRAGLSSIHPHAFLSTDPNAPALDLGTLDPVSANWSIEDSWANGINDKNMVVGAAETAPNSLVSAFVFDGKKMIDLNKAAINPTGWFLAEATAINNAGEIVGTGAINGQLHGVLLEPYNGWAPSIPSKCIIALP